MYLFIFEDGEIRKRSTFDEADDGRACLDGMLDVIDITDAQHPKQYLEGNWVEMESVD